MQHRIVIIALATASAALMQPVWAQPHTQQHAQQHEVIVEHQVAGPAGGAFMPLPGQQKFFSFIGAEMSFAGKLVKGAPYSAQAITESTQTLADGNRIVHKNTASLYRDSDGRTRRDQTLEAIGPWAAGGEPLQTSVINDPVAGASYILDSRSHTARKMPPPPAMGDVVYFRNPGPGAPGGPMPPPAAAGAIGIREFHKDMNPKDVKTESLGKQMMEGVEVEGTRSVITIAAGEVGNERPIEMVDERWFSPELQTLVMSKHSDPRMGETVYRLTNLSRAEPMRSLFTVPPDYSVTEESKPLVMKKAKPEPR